ncbi:hypothetical protein [Nitratireductor sp. GCM10026969]|uniref:hypothetical protein n=1 Tax=Nitratireductor sp. GCM10026969 TaxID=3252645 RepID=UPI00360CC059
MAHLTGARTSMVRSHFDQVDEVGTIIGFDLENHRVAIGPHGHELPGAMAKAIVNVIFRQHANCLIYTRLGKRVQFGHLVTAACGDSIYSTALPDIDQRVEPGVL